MKPVERKLQVGPSWICVDEHRFRIIFNACPLKFVERSNDLHLLFMLGCNASYHSVWHSLLETRKLTKAKEDQQKSSKSLKKSSVKKSSNQQPVVSSWKCSSTAQWKYPLDLIVENLKQLKQLEQYLSQKVSFAPSN